MERLVKSLKKRQATTNKKGSITYLLNQAFRIKPLDPLLVV
jgi:hypothetical protein